MHVANLHVEILIRYVRNLERQVREMKGRISANPEGSSLMEENLSVNDGNTLRPLPPEVSCAAANERQSPGNLIPSLLDGSPANLFLEHRPSPTFADELKCLSLEATAERHLGSTSGVSFAKLTQMVLRRLSPDKADFVFANDHGKNTWNGVLNLSSPLDLADHTLFERLNESISIHPSLFGDFGLADIVQPHDAVALSDDPSDEAHVDQLVDFYFAHSHTLYPIINRGDFLGNLHEYRNSGRDPSLRPPLFMFRMWMVLAIGSTAFSAISLTEETESRQYYQEALRYIEDAMSGDFVRIFPQNSMLLDVD